MDESKINEIARKFADLMDADRANPSANVPTEMARISGAIREAIATLETQLAAANEAVRVLAKRVCVSEKYHAALITHKKPSDLDGVREELWKTIADVLNNPLARASVEKAGKPNE